MRFEWNENKRQSNLNLHKIDFMMIERNFGNDSEPLELIDTRKDYGETRHQKIMKINDILFSIVYTLRGQNIRLISARLADAKERKDYENRPN